MTAEPLATEQQPEPAPLPDDRFLDRELSWLAFNARVLELAEDDSLPLLERAKFLAIFASNLDEFFMVRVAGLKRRIATGIAVRAASGLMPREVLDAIYTRSSELMERQAELFHRDIQPALEEQDIHVLRWDEATPAERDQLSHILEAMVISQHFATAVNRFDGQNQRLRLAIEETGLVPLVGNRWEPTVTEDKLSMLLSLAADCHLIGTSADGNYQSAIFK